LQALAPLGPLARAPRHPLIVAIQQISDVALTDADTPLHESAMDLDDRLVVLIAQRSK
jgi:hypothetical protein